jgi:hypothetical protein
LTGYENGLPYATIIEHFETNGGSEFPRSRRHAAGPYKKETKVEKATGMGRAICLLAAVIAVLALAPAAFAQSTGTGYGGQAGGTAGQVAGGSGSGGTAGAVEGGGTGSAASEAGGNAEDGSLLAFTGLDLALIVGGGLLLLGGGVALSRMVARNPA